jgi:hypothetical protein
MPILDSPERSNATPALVDLEAFSIPRMVRRFLPMQRVKDLYVRARYPEERPLLENLLREMRVEYQVSDDDLARVPRSGGAIVAANHPFGLLDGAILGCLFGRVRPDVRILTNFLLAGIPELHDHCFFVDPFGHSGAVGRNRRALHQSLEWLKSGGLLVIFPAGEVSHIRGGILRWHDWRGLAVRSRFPHLLVGATALRFKLWDSSTRTCAPPGCLMNFSPRPIRK